MFRWAEPDDKTRIARLERAVIILSVLLVLTIADLGLAAWNDWNQTATNRALAETQSTLVTIAAGQRKIDKSQDSTIRTVVDTDKFQNQTDKFQNETIKRRRR